MYDIWQRYLTFGYNMFMQTQHPNLPEKKYTDALGTQMYRFITFDINLFKDKSQ